MNSEKAFGLDVDKFQLLRSANFLRDGEWDPENKITSSFRAIELGGEVGEVLNIIKKLERQKIGIPGSRCTANDLAEELADVVICADLLAMHYDIDLWSNIERKFNKTSKANGLETMITETEDV